MQEPIDEWIARIGSQPVPVLPGSLKQLGTLTANENTPLAKLSAVAARDPSLTVHLLRTCNSLKRSHLGAEVTTVEHALMMLGLAQLRRLPTELPVLDQNLGEDSRVWLLRSFSRAYHAAMFAREWATARRDMEVDEVYCAAQLHFVGEMVLAMFGTAQAQRIRKMVHEEHVPAEEAEYLVLGFSLDQLSLALAKQWHLPALVLDSLEAENASHPRALGIMLAVQLAKAVHSGWYNARTLGLLEQVAEFLNRPLNEIVAWTHTLGAEIARDTDVFEVPPAATLLPLIVPAQREAEPEEKTDVSTSCEAPTSAPVCLVPQRAALEQTLIQLQQNMSGGAKLSEMVATVMKGMHDGVGLNRVVFAVLSGDTQSLTARSIVGAENDPVFNRFAMRLNPPNLFTRLLEKQQAIWVNDDTRAKVWPLLPVEFRKLIATNTFFAMSLFINDKPIGMFYADRHSDACQLDETSYNQFKQLVTLVSRSLAPNRG